MTLGSIMQEERMCYSWSTLKEPLVLAINPQAVICSVRPVSVSVAPGLFHRLHYFPLILFVDNLLSATEAARIWSML